MAASGEITASGVIRQSFRIVRAGLPGSFLIAIVFSALPAWLEPTFTEPAVATLQNAVGRQSGPVLAFFYDLAESMASGLPVTLGNLVLTGFVVQAAMEDVAGRTTFADALRAALSRLPANFAISFLFYLGFMLGSLLFVVPGLVLSAMWVVAVPVHVAERGSILDAFRRSRSLTAGHRWPIFGLILIYVCALGAVIGFEAWLIDTLTSRGVEAGLVAGLRGGLDVAASLMSLTGSAGLAALYIALRRAKEGMLSRDLVEAFA